jgi:hypothetical protein
MSDGNQEQYRRLAKEIAGDNIVTTALARLLEQVVAEVCAAKDEEIGRLRAALKMYGHRDHWMSLGEDGPRVVWCARTHMDDGPDGFSTARATLTRDA